MDLKKKKDLSTVFRIMENECQILLCPLTSLCLELSEFLFYRSMEPWVSSGPAPCPRGTVLMEAFTCDSSFWRAGLAWAFTNLHSNHTLSQKVLTPAPAGGLPLASLEFYKDPIIWNHKEAGSPRREEGIVEELAFEQVLQGWTVSTSQCCSQEDK